MAEPALSPAEIDCLALRSSYSFKVVNGINIAKETGENMENSHIHTSLKNKFLRSNFLKPSSAYAGTRLR